MNQDERPAGGAEAPPHVWVYGNDHSPWVQAVLLALHERGTHHTNVIAPPLSVFARAGVLMPAARVGSDPWSWESERILVRLGLAEVAPGDRDALRRIFGGALERTESTGEFWRRFAWVRDGHPSAWRRHGNQFWRAFSIFYFFTVITIARRRFGTAPSEAVGSGFQHFEDRLASGARFLAGDSPSTVDYQLFGLVQMFCSIPGTSLARLREDPGLPRLRDWVGRMQARAQRYLHLHSGPYFDPRCPAPVRAPFSEQACYALGAVAMWLAFPVSIALTLFLVQRIRRAGLVPG